jgi:hypothetical protein
MSAPQVSLPKQVPPVPQVASIESWHTALAPSGTHRSPGGQSRVSVHWVWHRVNAQISGELQSLLIEQLCTSAGGAFELHPGAAA